MSPRFTSLLIISALSFAIQLPAAAIEWSVGWQSAAESTAPEAEAPSSEGDDLDGDSAADAEDAAEEEQPAGDAQPDETDAPAATQTATGQETLAESDELNAPELASVRVTVNVREGDQPVPDERVLLHVMRMPHELLASYSLTTDAAGEAVFSVPAVEGAEVFAQVIREQSYFSQEPIEINETAPLATSVLLPGLSRDPSVVKAVRMDTIAEPWEKYVVFTQVWNFSTEDGSIFQPEEGRAIALPLPEGATGVAILLGEEDAQFRQDQILWRGRINPLAPNAEVTPDLVVRFSIKLPESGMRLSSASELAFRQPLTIDVEGASFVIPRSSGFRKHPTLHVSADARICDELGDTACFMRFTDQTPPGLLMDGTPSLTIAGGMFQAGGVMRIDTDGWPAPSRAERRWALLLGLLATLGGAWTFGRALSSHRRRDNAELEADLLEDRRRDLLAQAEELAAAWERGDIRSADMERERERIREHLGVVLRRQRQLAQTNQRAEV